MRRSGRSQCRQHNAVTPPLRVLCGRCSAANICARKAPGRGLAPGAARRERRAPQLNHRASLTPFICNLPHSFLARFVFPRAPLPGTPALRVDTPSRHAGAATSVHECPSGSDLVFGQFSKTGPSPATRAAHMGGPMSQQRRSSAGSTHVGSPQSRAYKMARPSSPSSSVWSDGGLWHLRATHCSPRRRAAQLP